MATLKEVTGRIKNAYATDGVAGVTRFMADQITNERLDFDHMLKMAFRRAVLFGAASRLDEAFECLDQAIAFRDPALVCLGRTEVRLSRLRRFGETPLPDRELAERHGFTPLT